MTGDLQPGAENGGSSKAKPALSPTAIPDAEKKLQQDPRNATARTRLAALLSIAGRDSEAEDVLRIALQHGQRAPEFYHSLGTIYVHNKAFDAAANEFALELSLRPKSVQALLGLGTAYTYLGRADEATHAFETAKSLDPNSAEAYLGLGFVNNSPERYPYAVKYLTEYIKRSKAPGDGYTMLSRVYLNMKLYEKAVEAGKTATSLNPTAAIAWYNLGEAYSFRPGDQFLRDAATAYERVIQLSPHWGHAHFELGRVYTRLKRLPDAITEYEAAVREEPTVGRNHYQLGQALVQGGRVDEGKKELQKASTLISLNQREYDLKQKIAAVPKDPRNLFDLAQLYKQMGNYTEAEIWFADTLKLDPHYPDAETQLSQVRQAMNAPH